MRETRRADEMLPGLRVRFRAGEGVYAGTIASTRPVDARRVEFAFRDAFRWRFLNSDLFYRDRPDGEADEGEDAGADQPVEFLSDELTPVPAMTTRVAPPTHYHVHVIELDRALCRGT